MTPKRLMGVITVLLYSSGYFGDTYPESIPFWIIGACYSAIALGTLSGGWKTVKTLGVGLTDLKPVHGFAAETAGAIAVIGSSILGVPVSTTHTVTGAIMGVGMTRRLSAVKWGVAGNIALAWLFTIPQIDFTYFYGYLLPDNTYFSRHITLHKFNIVAFLNNFLVF